MLSEILFRRFAVVGALVLAVSALASAEAIRGTLVTPTAGEKLQLALASGGTLDLELDEGLDLTMRDPQLAKRLWELRGQRQDGGRFAVEKIFTVKDGELHRVTYYCEICHITTHEPGLCMCCQGDTDLRELPGE
ncbi:MAG: hypothetical protein OXJ37_00790 [Bryobacterales bacterium]|nr:hypothetical protein [Bryobacterales bacterium]MDE0624580.1 hypothetical protein [Bryobacterales bacterium]